MIAACTWNTVQVKNHMAQFTADTVETIPDLAINNNTASDTGSDCDKYTGGSTCADACNTLGQRGNVGVVINENRFINMLNK